MASVNSSHMLILVYEFQILVSIHNLFSRLLLSSPNLWLSDSVRDSLQVWKIRFSCLDPSKTHQVAHKGTHWKKILLWGKDMGWGGRDAISEYPGGMCSLETKLCFVSLL